MAKPRPSALKRQREQAKRDKRAAKAERREQRKLESQNPDTPEHELEHEHEPSRSE